MTKRDMLENVIIDESQEHELGDLRCVVIGRDKIGSNSSMEDARHHVLIIHPDRSLRAPGAFERIGVASLSPRHVDQEGVWVKIR